jgi:hypothetical protein
MAAMHRPTEFAKRFADRLAERHYTDDELVPRERTPDETGLARRVRETPPPYGPHGTGDDDAFDADDADRTASP